jgi:hypothetical protein
MPEALAQRSAELLRRFGPPEDVPPGLDWLMENLSEPPVDLLPLRVNHEDIAAIDLVPFGTDGAYASGPFFRWPGVRY